MIQQPLGSARKTDKMKLNQTDIWRLVASIAVLLGIQVSLMEAQSPPAKGSDPQAAARQKVLESDRWQRTRVSLNEWLAVQQLYTPDEVAVMREQFAEKTSKMSAKELEDLMNDLDERLKVLKSPEAEEARQWFAQHLAVVANPEAVQQSKRPDVANMTASQIRHELQTFQQQRNARLQAQADFDHVRRQQAQFAQSARDAQAANQQAPNRSAWPANQPTVRTQYSQRHRNLQPPPRRPSLMLSPWGNPIFIHQL